MRLDAKRGKSGHRRACPLIMGEDVEISFGEGNCYRMRVHRIGRRYIILVPENQS